MKIHYIAHCDNERNPQSMRICNPAGSNLVIYIAKRLRKEMDLDIISPLCSVKERGFFRGVSYSVVEGVQLTLPCAFRQKGTIWRIVKGLWQKLMNYFFILQKAEYGSTVIVYHSVSLAKPLRLLKWLKKCKIILQVEEIYADVNHNEKYRKIEYKTFKYADGFLFASEQLHKIINRQNKPYAIIYGVYEYNERIVPVYEDGRVHCIYAGTFNGIKGGAYAAIEAAQYLDDNYCIHIAGYGAEADVIRINRRIEINNANNECQVVFEGMRQGEEFQRCLQKCHIGLATQNPIGEYNMTSFPSKILTYMANGLKVVATEIPVLRSSSIDKSIVYSTTGSGKDIADAIRRAAEQESLEHNKVLRKLEDEFVEGVLDIVSRV